MTGTVTKNVVVGFHDYMGGLGPELVERCAPEGMVVIDSVRASYNEGTRDYTITATYGTLAQLAEYVGVGLVLAEK